MADPRAEITALWVMLGDARKASSRVRGYWLHGPLAALGVRSRSILTPTRGAVAAAWFRALRADVVILQKQYSRWHVLLARALRLIGKPVVLDLDDTPSWRGDPTTQRNAERLMGIASAVTVGSEALRDQAAGFNSSVSLIPSCVDPDEYGPPRAPEGDGRPLTLGWIGNGRTYGEDLVGILEGPLRSLAARRPLRFRVVGAMGHPALESRLADIPGLELELIHSIDWALPGATREALEGVDVGLYPLLDTEANRFKCGFKGIEYMALGLPVIASDCRAHRSILGDGQEGFLCADEADWTRALETLTEDPVLRQKMGERGRARVEEAFTTRRAAAAVRQVLDGVLGGSSTEAGERSGGVSGD